jgi:hypothetical protein
MPIGVKITPQGLRQLFSRVKSHLHAGYHHTKNFLGKVDHAVQTGKHIYNAIEPVINHYVPTHHYNAIHNTAIRGLSGYESLRNKVIDHHEDAVHQVGRVASNLKKSLPNLGL